MLNKIKNDLIDSLKVILPVVLMVFVLCLFISEK